MRGGRIRKGGLHGGSGKKLLGRSAGGAAQLPVFGVEKNINPYIFNRLTLPLKEPINHRFVGDQSKGGAVAHGIEAEAIPGICDVYLRAREAGALRITQEHFADNAYAILKALGLIGIVALVDEATGYQAVRERCRMWRSRNLQRFPR